MQPPLNIPNTPRITLRLGLGVTLALLVLTAIVGYIGFQARFLILGPQITVSEKLPMTTASSTVNLAGSTANITRLHLNGRQIFTDQEGYFNELVALTPGVNIITVSAEDRYGRVTQAVQTIVLTDMKN